MRLQREDGVVAVEFALILPILLVIMFGIIEFGFVLFEKQVITNASREGARAGIVQAAPKPSEVNIQDVVKAYLTGAGLAEAERHYRRYWGGTGSPQLPHGARGLSIYLLSSLALDWW